MKDDRVLGKRSRDRSIRVGEVEPQRRHAAARARERDEIEQLHHLVPDDALRLAIAELGIGLGDHDAIEEEPRREPRKPAPLVGIADAQRRARPAHDLKVDEARRERNRDVVSASSSRRRRVASTPCGSTMSSSTSSLRSTTTRLYSLVTMATCASRKRGSDRRDRRRRKDQIADAIRAREQNPHDSAAAHVPVSSK